MGLPANTRLLTLDAAVVGLPNNTRVVAGYGIGLDTSTAGQVRPYIQAPAPVHAAVNYQVVGDEDEIVCDAAITVTLLHAGTIQGGRGFWVVNASAGTVSVVPYTGQKMNTVTDGTFSLTTGQWGFVFYDDVVGTWRARAF